MPPKKKRKLQRNITSDTDSGGPSESDIRKDSRREKAAATTSKHPTQGTSTAEPLLHSSRQVSGFASQQELAKYAKSLGIKRLMLANLHQQSDLDNTYIGGHVMGHCSLAFSQGHDLSIFIQDESTTQGSQAKHLRVTIREELAEKMPMLPDDAKLFVYKSVVYDESGNFSQDHGKCLLVEGTEAQIWIVHRDVRKPNFFSDTSCGKKWWVKTKQKREKVQSLWSAKSTVETSKELATTSEGTTAASPSKYHTRSTNSAGRNEANQPDSQSSTFPDNSDFPDSAFEGNDPICSDPESSDISDSSSSEEDSDREWRIRNRKTGRGKEYKYTKLSDLQVGETKVNIIGVVKEFKPPAITRGSDYYSTLTLVDETDQRVGVKCIMFNKAPEKLPQIKRVGDMVCLHRTSITSYNCQTQVQGHKYSSATRFSGDVSKKILASTGSVSYTCTHLERDRVKELRVWAREVRRRDALCSLELVTPDKYFDLVCQVVSVTISKSPRCTILTVWDATPHTIQCRTPTLEKRHEEGYPIVKEDQGISDDSEGYEIYVVIYNKKCIHQASKLLPGQFVCLQNLHSVMSATDRSDGKVEICMQKEDGVVFDTVPPRIEVLDKRDELHVALEKRIEQAISSVTVTPHSNQPLCVVSEITSYAQSLPAKFRCRAKVLRVSTPSLEDMVIARCSQCNHAEMISRDSEMDPAGISQAPCPACSRLDEGNHTPPHLSCQFYFKMAMGDRSGSVEVMVPHEEAVQLFNGLRPNNLYQYQELRYRVMEKLYALTGGNAPFETGGGEAGRRGGGPARPRPWMECCVLTGKHDESVYCCLFDTKLKL